MAHNLLWLTFNEHSSLRGAPNGITNEEFYSCFSFDVNLAYENYGKVETRYGIQVDPDSVVRVEFVFDPTSVGTGIKPAIKDNGVGKSFLNTLTVPGDPGIIITFAASDNQAQFISLQILSPMGSEVRSWHLPLHGRGTYSVTWDRLSDSGKDVPLGNYFVILDDGNKVMSTRLPVE